MTAFFSSSKIRLIQTVFQEVQQSDKVKHAEEILKGFRKEQDFQMTLATFMTRSNDSNQRLLAMLELKKRVVIKEKQTFWILKDIYYQDIDKISSLIRSIVTSTVNIELAGQFLNFNFEKMGVVEAVRYIEIVYGFLKREQRYEKTIEYYFQQLSENFLSLIEAVIENQDTFFMSIVILSVFYRCSLQLNRSLYIDKLKNHWRILQQKCKFYWSQNCLIVKMTIQSLLFDKISAIPSTQLFNLFNQTLKCISSNNIFKTKYFGLLFRLVVQNLPIFADRSSLYALINALSQYSRRENQIALMDCNFNRQIELNNFMQRQVEDEEVSLIRLSMGKVIQSFFQKYFKQLQLQFCQIDNNGANFLISIIHLLNFYNSTNHLQIKVWVQNNMEYVVNQIGTTIRAFGYSSGYEKITYVNNCISIIQFLIKYKTLISIVLLPHTVLLLQQLSFQVSTLSPFCYNFVNHIWQDLVNMDFDSLTDFLFRHVSEINRNEWDHRLNNYSGFLNLAKCLQENYNFFSKFLMNDKLIQESIKAHQIMINDVIQNEFQQLNHEIIGQLVEFTSYFIDGLCQQDFRSFYLGLNIASLVRIIDQYKIYTIESAIVVAFHNFINNRTNYSTGVISLIKDKEDPDFEYKIHLYLRQFSYFAPTMDNSCKKEEVDRINMNINNLLAELGEEKGQKLMRSSNWSRFLVCSLEQNPQKKE